MALLPSCSPWASDPPAALQRLPSAGVLAKQSCQVALCVFPVKMINNNNKVINWPSSWAALKTICSESCFIHCLAASFLPCPPQEVRLWGTVWHMVILMGPAQALQRMESQPALKFRALLGNPRLVNKTKQALGLRVLPQPKIACQEPV